MLTSGAIRLFRVAGIDVFLHWSWFVVAIFEINDRAGTYSSIGWNIAEYLALFLIVMTHEFGHSLACRQVGGSANRIVLWPLGGVAFVNPPPRPGATLWSIAAGPLVNVALLPVFLGLVTLSRSLGWPDAQPDAYAFLQALLYIDAGLLIFNVLPIYPLDGGQILRSLLWFVLGRARSLMAATVLGFVGAAGIIYLAVQAQSLWYGIMAAFILMNCWQGWQHARELSRFERTARHNEFACPSCKASPPIGDYWFCPQCGNRFDTFRTQAVCPHCAAQFSATRCIDCGRSHSISEWATAVLAQPVESRSLPE